MAPAHGRFFHPRLGRRVLHRRARPGRRLFRGGVLAIVAPALVGLSGPALTADEAALLRDFCPLGVILFARNIESPAQLGALIGSLRKILPDAVLMVDQEGGRVARLRPPHWLGHPPARRLADAGERAAWLTGALIGLDCAEAGFDVVAAPCLDVASADGHDVIGDRAFSNDPEIVAALGGTFAKGLLAAGIIPVGKHAPGHGRARADSHLAMPELDGIDASDLVPFRRCAWLPWLMTAHIRYISVDAQRPATLSPTVIGDVVRAPGGIGFDGVLVSDDLAMHALSGPEGARAAAALAAGCDVVLHCSGVFGETRDVLEAVPAMRPETAMRLEAGRVRAAEARRALDRESLVAERAALLAC